MNRKRTIIGIAIVVAVLTVVIFQPKNTGLLTLPKEILQKDSAESKETMPIQAELSFQAVEPTTLKASLAKGTLFGCPKKELLEFSVENTGKATAERVFLEFENMEVTRCGNCQIWEIHLEKKETVLVEACKVDSAKNAAAVFYALNSGKVEILLG